ncbi:mitochondrial assembly of ribosomal large subunit protein 1 [Pempheris klunzingeri]|uniref:mitochondrial assembly of ribosomal large subunit protein 1 n=1 Tax=Pempheris klunzingeri TaxID=3127111 RepID=UPI00397E9AF0
MNIFNRSKTVVSSVFRSGVLLDQTGVCRSVCSVHKGRYSLSLSRGFTANLSSCQQHLFSGQSDTGRFYSEMCSESSDSKRSSGLHQEGAQELDSDSSRRSPEKFSLDVLVSLLRQENAMDICVIKVPEHIKYTEHFIVVSGVSPRHLRAMALYAIKVYKFLRKDGEPHVKIEGKDAEDWMCIDFGNMVVHFMLPESREVYELEKLWTLRTYDEQLKRIPAEMLPEDFIYDADVTK